MINFITDLILWFKYGKEKNFKVPPHVLLTIVHTKSGHYSIYFDRMKVSIPRNSSLEAWLREDKLYVYSQQMTKERTT